MFLWLLVFLLHVPQVNPPGAIEGVVLEDHSGEAISAAVVRLSRPDGTVLKEAETDRSGRFSIAGVDAGEYWIALTKPNYMAMTASLSAKPNPPYPLVFRLVRFGVISGHVLPPQAGRVIAIEKVPAGVLPRTFTATVTAGEYRLFGLPRGRFIVGLVNSSNGTGTPLRRGLAFYPSNSQPREFLVSGGEDYSGIDIFAPPGPGYLVSGKITSIDKRPSLLTLVSPDYPSVSLQTITSSENGTFRLANVMPGPYDVLVVGFPAGPALFGRVRIRVGGQDIDDLDIVMQPARSAEFGLDGKVPQDVLKACGADAAVTLTRLEAWSANAANNNIAFPLVSATPTRSDILAPGPHAVSARSAKGGCFGTTSYTLDLTQESASSRAVMLHPPSSIRGKVEPRQKATTVAVVVRDVQPGRDSPIKAVVTDSGSEVLFENLAPGGYCVAAFPAAELASRWAPESGCGTTTIELQAGESRSVNLR